MKRLNKLRVLSFLVAIFIVIFFITSNTKANETFYTRNDILFYDANDSNSSFSQECQDSVNGGPIKGFENLTFNNDGQNYLNKNGDYIKRKITEPTKFGGKTRQQLYVEAVTKAGMPAKAWIFLAIIDLNERGFGTEKSILNGINFINSSDAADGVVPGKTYTDDLLVAANHLLGKMRSIKFNVNDESQWTVDNIANSFLTWNRGSMYHISNLNWRDSGYVNNYSNSYSNNGYLDTKAYCSIAPKYGARCGHLHHKLGSIHLFKYINDNFSTNQNISSNNIKNETQSLSNRIDCEEYDYESGVNNSRFGRALKKIYTKYAWQVYCKKPTKDCDPNRPKNPEMLNMPPYNKIAKNRGNDCGAWVTFVIQNSGIDPNYNPNVAVTYDLYNDFTKYSPGWKLVGYYNTPGKKNISQSELQPGDVAIAPGHTWLYIGDGIFSAASLGERYPMKDGFIGSSKPTKWYRKAN